MWQWWKARKEEKKKKHFSDGYDFAAGEMLRSKGKAEDFLNSYSIMVFDYDDFDRGIQKAIRDYNNLVDKVNSK